MSLVFMMFATILSPMVPIGGLLALIFGIAGLNSLANKRVGAALLRFVLACASGWLCVTSLPAPRLNWEAMAIGECRSIASAEEAYASANEGSYGSLRCLENPTSCGWPAGLPPFIDPQLASLRHGKYVRSFIAGPAGKGKIDPGIATFLYVATPIVVGEGSVRGFAVDQTGRVCYTTDGSIPAIVNGALSPTCTAIP